MHKKALHVARFSFTEERRRDTRLLCSDLVSVEWTDLGGGRRKEFGVLENVAVRGASLLVGVPVPAGSEIHIDCPPTSFSGVARHCSYVTNGYLVGVEFDAASLWSQEAYAPEHLLDPRELDGF